tara:strand:+ start:3148 stop:3927 length:780 start_codon:yes stop_codon:yes gene_type:complete
MVFKNDPTAVLELSSIKKQYGGVKALNDISISFPKGTITAIVGDNGAGKSTTLKIISGAEFPDSGQIFVNGVRVKFRFPEDARQAGIETVYQDLALADNLTATENLFMGREEKWGVGGLAILRQKKMQKMAMEIFKSFSINIPSVRVPVAGMSGGQRQGVAIARAVNWGSDLVLLDEPTAALGVTETSKVEDVIKGLRDRGLTQIIVSHNLDQVFRLSDRIAVMRRGELVSILKTKDTNPELVIGYITGVLSKEKYPHA